MKILITDNVDNLLIELLENNSFKLKRAFDIERSDALNIIENFDGLIVRNRLEIDDEFLQKAKKLKFIARFGSGMELIDTNSAKKLGICCFNSAEGNSKSVAEHALGLLLGILKNTKKSMFEMKNKIWNREGNRGNELSKKTVGIIGYGNTGSKFAHILKMFDCKIIAYDKYKSGFGDKFVEEVDLDKIHQLSDIISFHIPLNNETKYFFNSNFLNRMSKKFYLINTSRGRIVRNSDLIEGLESGKILGAGLDVHETENKNFSKVEFNSQMNFLLNHENVILTPHIAGITFESKINLSTILFKKIQKFK